MTEEESTPLKDSDGNPEDVYYFESDHLALKGNHDYGLLLKTVAVLESQRLMAIKDLDKLHEARSKALQDPIKFVDQLQQGVKLDVPKPQKIASLPLINWEHYTSNLNLVSMGHMTRLKKSHVEGNTSDLNASTSSPFNDTFSEYDSKSGVTVVRGRVKDEKKSSTFNQLWTVDEQRRLEELLVQYPPEEVEAKRWQKIANALGNRTLQQVASRVQKYFIKLAKAGLPVPGKVPNLGSHSKRSAHRHHRYQKFYYHPSTFMNSHEPPVYMSDDEDGYSGENSMDMDWATGSEKMENPSDDEEIPESLKETEEYKDLLKLKQIKKQKLQGSMIHEGFKCDKCGADPITGVRWHCLDCPSENSVDFCADCVDTTFDAGNHNSSHRLEAFRNTDSHIDQDYTRFAQSHYNYLDPNYMPAT